MGIAPVSFFLPYISGVLKGVLRPLSKPKLRAKCTALDDCIRDVKENKYDDKEKHKAAMLGASQDMLQSVWDRMKQEAGISKRSDGKYEKAQGLQTTD